MSTKPKANLFEKNLTLFFSGLSNDVQEKEINDFINQKAEEKPKAINIVHNNIYPTNIAYIQFATHESAQIVMEKLNGEIYKENRLGVSWCISTKDLKNIEVNNLLVKNLKEGVTTQIILNCCKTIGEVLSLKISLPTKDNNKRYCFIKFNEEKARDQFIESKEKLKEYLGNDIIIEKFEKRQNKTNLYVCNIGKEVTEQEFVSFFEKQGKIKEFNGKKSYLLVDKEGLSTKFGFVDYESKENAEKVMREFNGSKELKSDNLHIEMYLNKKERVQNRQRRKREIKEKLSGEYKNFNLFIKKRESEPFKNEAELKQLFGKYGEIFTCRIKYEKNGDKYIPANVAYVCFTNAEAANKVLSEHKDETSLYEVHILQTREQRRYGMNQQNMPYNLVGSYPNPQTMFPFYPPFPLSGNQKQPQPNPRKGTKNGNGGKKPKQQTKQQPQPKQQQKPQPKQQEPTSDQLQDLGDGIYDYIENEIQITDEELIGKITGVLLSSYDYYVLKEKFDNKELRPVVDDIVKNLKEQSN